MEIIERELYKFKNRKIPKKIYFKPIGILHSKFKDLKGIPIQSFMSESKGVIEIYPQYQSALKDLDGFSYIFCLYFFDMVKLPVPLQSKPFLDNQLRGVFATRTPFRPNRIGLSILEVLNITKNKIDVNNVDILDKTPILDIKPYVAQFDSREPKRIGWLQGKIKKKTS